MTNYTKRFSTVLLFLVLSVMQPASGEWSPSWNTPTPDRPALDVPYVPTPMEVVNKMLSIAGVNGKDVLYDLGCGDGRIVVTAAKERKVRKAVGIDLDPQRIRESTANAREAGVSEHVIFEQKNLFDMDFSEATVVTMYLLPTVNLKLRPKLLKDLKPGTRLVSHDFDMGDWQPDRVVRVEEHTVYYWVIPVNASGSWTWSIPEGKQSHRYELHLNQKFQNVDRAELRVDGKDQSVSDVRISGDRLEFKTEGNDAKGQSLQFTGTVKGNSVRGAVFSSENVDARKRWAAERDPGTAVSIDAPSPGQLSL